MTLLASASRYAERGLPVFQLAPESKVPIKGSRGYLDATSDQDVTRARWDENPSANNAAPTGAVAGFFVLDADDLESLARLLEEHGPLPVTATASTPHGGSHFYLKHVDGIRNSAGRIGPGLDVRGEGGSIVLPPSVLTDGGRYRWVSTAPVAEAPEWLIKLALPPPPKLRPKQKPLAGDISNYVSAAVFSELRILMRAGPGTRNDTLNQAAFNIAGFVHAAALPEAWARDKLEAVAADLGLPVLEARRTINSAFRAAPARELPR